TVAYSVQMLNAGGCNDTKAGEARRIPSQAGFLENGGTSGRRQEENEGPCVCDPETCREEPPLRSSSGAGWRDEELGRPERAQSRPVGQATRHASGRSSDRLQRVRGNNPSRRIRRRDGDGVGQGDLRVWRQRARSHRGSAAWLREGRFQVRVEGKTSK